MHPTAVRVEATARGQRWVFPYRDLPGATSKGFGLMGIGIFGMLFTLLWTAAPVSFGIGAMQAGDLMGGMMIAFGSLGMIGFLATLRFALLGLAIVRNKTQSVVELRDGKLLAMEKFCRFTWLNFHWKVSTSDIKEFSLTDSLRFTRSKHRVENGPGKDQAFFNFLLSQSGTNLVACKRSNERQVPIALLYPETMLSAFADTLIESIASTGQKIESPSLSVGRLVEEERARKNGRNEDSDRIPLKTGAAIDSDLRLPKSSSIVIHEKPNSQVAYEVPPQGLGALYGLGFFAIFWLGMSLFMFFGVLTQMMGDPTMENIFLVGFASIFVAIGLGIGLFCLDRSRQKTMIGVLEGQLFIEKTSLLGQKWTDFNKSDLLYVEVGNSNMAVNDVPVRELKICSKNSPKDVGLLSVLTDAELDFLANDLNARLGLTVSRFDLQQPGNLWKSKLRVTSIDELLERETPKHVSFESDIPGQVQLTIRGRDFIGASVGVVVGLIFAGVGAGIIYFNSAELPAVIFGGVFFTIGLAAVVNSILFSFWRYDIEATADELSLHRHWLLGNTRYHWRSENLESIDINPTLANVNTHQNYVLQIVGDPTKNLLYAVNGNDLAFVAGHLNRVVKIPKTVDGS